MKIKLLLPVLSTLCLAASIATAEFDPLCTSPSCATGSNELARPPVPDADSSSTTAPSQSTERPQKYPDRRHPKRLKLRKPEVTSGAEKPTEQDDSKPTILVPVPKQE